MKQITKEEFITLMIKSFLNFNNLTIGDIKITDIKNENNNLFIRIAIEEGKPKNMNIKFSFNGIIYSCDVELTKSESYLQITNINNINKEKSTEEFSVEPYHISIISLKSENIIFAQIKKVSLNYVILKINKIHIDEVLHYNNSKLNIPNVGEIEVKNSLTKIGEDYIEIKSSFIINSTDKDFENKFYDLFYYSKQNTNIEDLLFKI